MPGPFTTATAVSPAGDGVWAGAIDAGWDIGGKANGGYLLAIAARALLGATRRPDPVTVTGHFLSPGPPGAVRVATQVLKQGRRFATAAGTLLAGDRPLLAVLGTCGDLAETAGPELVDGAPPDLPPPGDCVAHRPGRATAASPPAFMDRVDLRLHPEDASFATKGPSGQALVRGWFRFPDDEPVDTVGLLCAVDAFPPTVFNAGLPVGWVPTVELTVHVRARPVPGWLRCRFSTRFVTSGFLEEDGEVWDATGRLVAQSRQLALVALS